MTIPFRPTYAISDQRPAAAGMQSPASGMSVLQANQAAKAEVIGAAGDLLGAAIGGAAQVSAQRESARDNADYLSGMTELSRLTAAADMEAERIQFDPDGGAESYKESLEDIYSRRDAEFEEFLRSNSPGGIPNVRGQNARDRLAQERQRVSGNSQLRIQALVAQREEQETRLRWDDAINESISSATPHQYEAQLGILRDVAEARAQYGDSPTEIERDFATWRSALAKTAALKEFNSARYVADLMTLPGGGEEARGVANEHYDPQSAGDTVRSMVEGAMQRIVAGEGVYSLLEEDEKQELLLTARQARREAHELISDREARRVRDEREAINTATSEIAALMEGGAGLDEAYAKIDVMDFNPEDRMALRSRAASYASTMAKIAQNPEVPVDFRQLAGQANAVHNLRVLADRGEIRSQQSWQEWEDAAREAAENHLLSPQQFVELHKYGREAFDAILREEPLSDTHQALQLLNKELDGYLKDERLVFQTSGPVVEDPPDLRDVGQEGVVPEPGWFRNREYRNYEHEPLGANDLGILDRALTRYVERNPDATETELREFVRDLLLPRRRELIDMGFDARIRAMTSEPLIDDAPVETPRPRTGGAATQGGTRRPGLRQDPTGALGYSGWSPQE